MEGHKFTLKGKVIKVYLQKIKLELITKPHTTFSPLGVLENQVLLSLPQRVNRSLCVVVLACELPVNVLDL